MASGLYDRLVKDGHMVAHEEVADLDSPHARDAYRVIKPTQIPFISYPYEWSFSQLKDAALATLQLQKAAPRSAADDAGAHRRDSSADCRQAVAGQGPV
jgi:hypothetical protein